MSAEAVRFTTLENEMSIAQPASAAGEAEIVRADPTRWVDMYGDCLFRFAYIRLRDESAAEDVVQETFVSALRSLDSYNGRAEERTWLVGILKHKIYDHFRRSARETQIDEDEELAAVAGFFERPDAWDGHWVPQLQPVDPEQTPDEVVEREEFWRVMNSCMGAMPDRVARVFALREIDGLSSDEICRLLCLTASNFWVIMHRARMQLRRCIEIKWFRKAI